MCAHLWLALFFIACPTVAFAESLMEPGLWGVLQETPLVELRGEGNPHVALGGTVGCLSKETLDADPFFLRGVATSIKQANLACGIPLENRTKTTAS